MYRHHQHKVALLIAPAMATVQCFSSHDDQPEDILVPPTDEICSRLFSSGPSRRLHDPRYPGEDDSLLNVGP